MSLIGKKQVKSLYVAKNPCYDIFYATILASLLLLPFVAIDRISLLKG